MGAHEAAGACLGLFPEAILVVARDGLIEYANPAARRAFPAIDPGRSSLLKLIEEPPEKVREYLALCLRSSSFCPGRFQIGEAVVRTEGARYMGEGGGDQPHVLLRLRAYRHAVKRFVALNEQIEQLSREITRRRQVEAELTEQRERLRVTLSGIGDAVIATDESALITFMNPVAEQQTGWPVQDALGKPVDEVFRIINEETRLTVVNPVHRVLREGMVVGLANHTVLIRRDGSEIHIDDSGAPIRDADGRVLGAVLVFHDISERRKLERQLEAHTLALEEAHRRKDEFLAMLGHELRNPLAPIKTALLLLEMAKEDPDKSMHAHAVMRRQVDHLARLVDELLDVARITTGRIQLKTESVDLDVIARQAIEQCEPLLRAKEQRFEYHSANGPLRVQADIQRLTQAIANLLHNANRYTPAGGEVKLTLRRAGNDAEIIVDDTGRGVEAEVMPHIFDMFRQAGRTLARSEGGLGVGLTLVRRLVELHGGTVTATSPGPGKGSRFTIRIPLAQSQPAAVAPAQTPIQSRSRSVLVVDDNVDAATILAEVLELSGHRVRVAHDAAGTLGAVRAELPDLAFLDIGLPGTNGYELARALRREFPGAPMLLVALTGYGQPEDRHKAHEAGFDHHLVKPAPIEEMMRILESLQGVQGPTPVK